ncbi:MAG TPA: ribonuclease G [Candidatus Methylomirabilis sp.]|nr:ribonuclease G [Candidatus Methylomirabilis sp.]
MSEEILINVTPQETRVAVVENGVLQEVYIERARSRGIVGNIYKGKVVRILPGMQAAFVDIGLDRTAFLHASDIRTTSTPENGSATPPPIHELLSDGQEIVVQVVKDPIGTKGARLTMQITLPARYLVYLPDSKHIGISQKIGDETTRERLRALMKSAMGEGAEEGGFILRTLAESASEDEIETDIRYLRRVWAASQERIRTAPVPGLIHEDLPLALRAMRDLVRDNVEKIRIDSREVYTKAIDFGIEFIPEVADRIEHYPGERPIFDLYSVEDEIQKALDRKVILKSGGYLILDQTEAMTTIDVNTGAYVGRRNLEETLFKTNLEAAQAIARQLRLRNLGGMIIVDFIDMAEAEHKRQVLRALERALSRDRTKVYMTEMSPLGLVELTRKRTRESLEHVLCQPCPVCQGRGMVKTPQTVCYEIFREILREVRQYGADEYLVLASQPVIDLLLDEEAGSLMKLQEFIGKPIQLKVEPLYTQQQYDVVLV